MKRFAILIGLGLALCGGNAWAQERGPEICRYTYGDLDVVPTAARDGFRGFTDNNGEHVEKLSFTYQRCGPDPIQVRDAVITLSNGAPLETCDECREAWEAAKTITEMGFPR